MNCVKHANIIHFHETNGDFNKKCTAASLFAMVFEKENGYEKSVAAFTEPRR